MKKKDIIIDLLQKNIALTESNNTHIERYRHHQNENIKLKEESRDLLLENERLEGIILNLKMDVADKELLLKKQCGIQHTQAGEPILCKDMTDMAFRLER